jgi:hypothetical protein
MLYETSRVRAANRLTPEIVSTPPGNDVSVRPITSADLHEVGRFLHDELNHRLSPAAWATAMKPSWQGAQPNYGFMLRAAGRVVGAQLAFYSERRVGAGIERFCNIAAWCVAPTFRAHGFRLLRAVLAQKEYSFTDLSPSGNVVPLNQRLNFRHFDTGAVLMVNLPLPNWGRGISVVSDRQSIEATLGQRDLEIYRDHAFALAAHHLVVVRGNERCYVMFRRDRRKRLPLFASILHVSNPSLFRDTARIVASHLLIRHGIAATLLEHRVVGFRPRFAAIHLRTPRAKMYRSGHLEANQIDYLYSELVSVPW